MKSGSLPGLKDYQPIKLKAFSVHVTSHFVCGRGNSNSSMFRIFRIVQELLKDITVNFLSDALWALVVLLCYKFIVPFLKKSNSREDSYLRPNKKNILTCRTQIQLLHSAKTYRGPIPSLATESSPDLATISLSKKNK